MREVRISLEYVQRAFDRAIYIAVKNRSPLHIGHSLYIHGKVLPFLEKQTASGLDFSRIALKADTTVHLKKRVLRGELHMGFGVMPVFDKDLWVAPVAHENFSVCIPDTHPFKDKGRLSAHDLRNETVYWMPRYIHPPLYDQVTDYLSGVGHDLHNLHEAQAIIQGIDMAAAKLESHSCRSPQRAFNVQAYSSNPLPTNCSASKRRSSSGATRCAAEFRTSSTRCSRSCNPRRSNCRETLDQRRTILCKPFDSSQ